jgi:hypothetical protein
MTYIENIFALNKVKVGDTIRVPLWEYDGIKDEHTIVECGGIYQGQIGKDIHLLAKEKLNFVECILLPNEDGTFPRKKSPKMIRIPVNSSDKIKKCLTKLCGGKK